MSFGEDDLARLFSGYAFQARRAFDLIKARSHSLLGTIPNLYKVCRDGVELFKSMRPQIIPANQPVPYGNLAGQREAETLSTATLDDVLTCLVYETKDHKWCWSIVGSVGDRPFMFGEEQGHPLDSRGEAEKAAIAASGMIGARFEPVEEYEPVEDAETKSQIRVDGTYFVVSHIPIDKFRKIIFDMMKMLHLPPCEKSMRKLEYIWARGLLVPKAESIDQTGRLKGFFMMLLEKRMEMATAILNDTTGLSMH